MEYPIVEGRRYCSVGETHVWNTCRIVGGWERSENGERGIYLSFDCFLYQLMSHEKHLFTGLTSWIWLRLWVANNSDFSKHWNKTLAQNPVQFAPLAVCLLKLFEESRLGAMKTLQKLMCTPDVSQVIQQFSRISRWSTQPPCAEPVATVLKEGDSDANNLHTNLTWWNTKSSCAYTVTSWCCKYPTKLPVFKQFQMVIPVRFYTPTVSFKFKFWDFVHLKGRTSHQNTLRL